MSACGCSTCSRFCYGRSPARPAGPRHNTRVAALITQVRLRIIFLLGLAAALVPGILAAASPVAVAAPAAAPAQEKIQLRLATGVWGAIPQKDASDPLSRARRAVFERFLELHPNVDVVPASGIQLQGRAFESGFLMSMAGGTAPDVFYVNFRKLESFVKQGFVLPLDEFIARDPETLEGIHQQILDVIRVDGKVYCIPYQQWVMALYYRRDLFKEAGLDPDHPPRDWDEFYEYCQRLTNPARGQYGFVFSANPQGTSYFWSNFLYQAGGDVAVKGPDGRWQAAFDNEAGVKALEFYRKLRIGKWERDGRTVTGVAARVTDMPQLIDRGKVGMWMGYLSDLTTSNMSLNPSLLGISILPAGPAGHSNEINASMWAINSQIKDARVREMAWEFVKFQRSDEAERLRTKAFIEAGMGKFVNPQYLRKFGYEEYLDEVPDQWVAANEDAFRYGHPEPHGENMDMIYTLLDEPLERAELNPNLSAERILRQAAEKINAKLLNYTPPEVMQQRRRVAWVTVLLLGAAVAFVATRQVRALAMAHSDATRDSHIAARGGWKVQAVAWFFMLPAVLSIALWAYYPLLRGMVMAFQDYRIVGGSMWVGLDNFIEAFGQETFWIGIRNSIFYVLLSLAMGFFAPIFLALMLSEIPRGKMLFRTLYYLPAVTSGLIILFLWKWFYDPSFQGLFNTLLDFFLSPFGMSLNEPVKFLNDPNLAMISVILPTVWATAGPGSIIYLAALKGIPDEMYEAADVDGAGIFTKIFRITLPSLKALIIINFVGAFIGAFKATENIFVMTGGGPLNATHTIGLEIWYNAFLYLKFGYATAAAWIMGSMLIGFTMYQLRILRDLRFSTAEGGK